MSEYLVKMLDVEHLVNGMPFGFRGSCPFQLSPEDTQCSSTRKRMVYLSP
jgi:hypothetical protein